MSEENQDNEMEDILSSIKNILEKDEQEQAGASTENLAIEADVLGDVLNTSSEADDILELSQDMRLPEVENPVAEVAAPVTEVEADPVAEIVSAPVENPVFEVAAPVAEVEADPVAEIVSAPVENPVFEVAAPVTEVEADPVAEIVSAPVENPVAEVAAPVTEIEADPVAEIVSAPVENPVFEVSAPITEVEADPVAEIVSAPVENPVAEVAAPLDVVDNLLTDEPTVPEPVVASEPEAKEAVKANNVVDVSANIISNFAKMFSREDPITPAAPAENNTPSVTITSPGDVSKTLEDFVLDSITKVIGKEISRQWNDGAEYNTFAKEEIVRQTQAWINDNLPTLVENVVKQEIERVIAKVGS